MIKRTIVLTVACCAVTMVLLDRAITKAVNGAWRPTR